MIRIDWKYAGETLPHTKSFGDDLPGAIAFLTAKAAGPGMALDYLRLEQGEPDQPVEDFKIIIPVRVGDANLLWKSALVQQRANEPAEYRDLVAIIGKPEAPNVAACLRVLFDPPGEIAGVSRREARIEPLIAAKPSNKWEVSYWSDEPVFGTCEIVEADSAEEAREKVIQTYGDVDVYAVTNAPATAKLGISQ